jgi:Raf kinase inhibitor-like YbhB/YbcL family protein
MRTRRQVLGAAVAGAMALAGCSAGKAGGDNSAAGLFAPGFESGTIPELYTCEGGNISPELAISDVSRETDSFAIIMDDPDAPGSEPYVHWLIWNIPPNTTTLSEGIPTQPRVELSDRGTDPGFPEHESIGPALQGTNSADEIGYTGPCPPPEDPPHTYEITLYSLRSTLDVQPGAKRSTLESAIEDALMGTTTITETFER